MSAVLSVMTGGDDGWVIEAIELTTRLRRRRALEAVSFQVRPGQVTGLLGLPGSGKTAVLRRMLQLERGGGRTLYDGRPFRSLAFPMRSVGVLLDPLAVHPGRTVTGHLRLALSADPESAPAGRRERIEAVLDVVGLADQARTRIFELSEGMTVRLGLAQALLGDPQALLLDEPECGLEAEGRPWLAALLRAYAAQGRCVLVTGQNTDAMLGYADRILVMDNGRLVGQRTTRQAARELAGDCVIVRTPQALRLAGILLGAGAEPTQLDGACLEVRGLDRARIGDLAFRNEVPLHELAVRTPGEDPVVAVLGACRKPPTVVPVQTPPAVCVPQAAAATVHMPFEDVLNKDGKDEVLRPSELPRPAEPEPVLVDMEAQTQLISVVPAMSKNASNVKVIESEVVADGDDEPTVGEKTIAGGITTGSSSALATSSSTLMRSDGLSAVPATPLATVSMTAPLPGPTASAAASMTSSSSAPESASVSTSTPESTP